MVTRQRGGGGMGGEKTRSGKAGESGKRDKTEHNGRLHAEGGLGKTTA